MRCGAVIPYAAERDFAELAAVAEAAGWDAVFSWEAVWGQDAWVTLAAAAMTTQRIRLGPLLTPVPAQRPWELAQKIASVDRLSDGRVTVSVGLGAVQGNWSAFLPDEGRAVRARQLDEGLDVVAGLLRGQPFSYAGTQWSISEVTELIPPGPVQRPHPPIWCVGALVPGRTRQPSLERAARWQGKMCIRDRVLEEDQRLGYLIAGVDRRVVEDLLRHERARRQVAGGDEVVGGVGRGDLRVQIEGDELVGAGRIRRIRGNAEQVDPAGAAGLRDDEGELRVLPPGLQYVGIERLCRDELPGGQVVQVGLGVCLLYTSRCV